MLICQVKPDFETLLFPWMEDIGLHEFPELKVKKKWLMHLFKVEVRLAKSCIPSSSLKVCECVTKQKLFKT